MSLQNRVTPSGDIVAASGRGLLMGNRGILHGDDRTLGTARWRHRHWVTCRLDVAPGRQRRSPMTPGHYTELFFLDEATALAAGHRPCAQCRRGDYRRFVGAWASARGENVVPTAPAIDAILHAARLDGRAKRTITRSPETLPNGAFVAVDNAEWLVQDGTRRQWTPDGYADPKPLGTDHLTVLTPEPTLLVLAAGYQAALHPSAAPQPQ